MRVLVCLHPKSRRFFVVSWKQPSRRQNFDNSNAALGPFVQEKKKKRSALHQPPSHSRGKWPSLRWWHKACVSYLMQVIFWHVGQTAEMLCIMARGIMAVVGVGLIKTKKGWNWSEQEKLLAMLPSELLVGFIKVSRLLFGHIICTFSWKIRATFVTLSLHLN